jgi:hypothetical protein
MEIDPGVGQLIIKGHISQSGYLGWFNFVKLLPQIVLVDIGRLNTDADISETCGRTCFWLFGSGYITMVAGFASAFLCPPAVPFLIGGGAAIGVGGSMVAISKATLEEITKSPLKVLGQPPA